MSTQGLTPAQTAYLDQAHADVGRRLDAVIEAHHGNRSEGQATRQVDIAGLASWLSENTELIDLAEMLAVAVDRLEQRR